MLMLSSERRGLVSTPTAQGSGAQESKKSDPNGGANAPTHSAKRGSLSSKELAEFDFTGIDADLAR